MIIYQTQVPLGKIESFDWGRFQSYASRVRMFKYLDQLGSHIDDVVFGALFLKIQEQPLLPALRNLRWDVQSPTDLPLVAMFLAPTLQHLNISHDRMEVREEHPIDRFLRKLRASVPTSSP